MLVTMTTQHSWYSVTMPSSGSAAWEMMGTCSRVGEEVAATPARASEGRPTSASWSTAPYTGGTRGQVDMEHNAVYIVYSLDLCKPPIHSFIVSWGRPWLLDPRPSAHPASDLSSARKFPTIMCRFPDDSRPVTR